MRIAETDGCFAVRGTAVYVIGMVSGTEQGALACAPRFSPCVADALFRIRTRTHTPHTPGRQRLERFGWDTPCHVNSHVSLPRDIRSTPFLRIDENEYIDVFVAPESETVLRLPLSHTVPRLLAQPTDRRRCVAGGGRAPAARSGRGPGEGIDSGGDHSVGDQPLQSHHRRARHERPQARQSQASLRIQKGVCGVYGVCVRCTDRDVDVQAALAKEILQMLERYRFRLPVRRFVYSLLDDSAFDRSFFAALANVRPVARKGTWTLAVPGHPGKP